MNVDDGHIHIQVAGDPDRVQTVAGHAGQLDAVGCRQVGCDRALRKRVVLNEQHTDHLLVVPAGCLHAMTIPTIGHLGLADAPQTSAERKLLMLAADMDDPAVDNTELGGMTAQRGDHRRPLI